MLIACISFASTECIAPAAAAADDPPTVTVPRVVPPLSGPAVASKPLQIRFVTAKDFPPFNFLDADGRLTGYNVELARALCMRLAVPCTIQVRPFPLLVSTVQENNADAIIAGLRDTPGLRAFVDYSVPYLKLPGRFVVRKDRPLDATPEALAGRTVAVVGGTRAADFIADFFPDAVRRDAETTEAALTDLAEGRADAVFASALAASFWLGGKAGACCRFSGDAFTESAYFGRGLTIAVDRRNQALKAALDETLAGLDQDGTLADLYLRFFPVPLY